MKLPPLLAPARPSKPPGRASASARRARSLFLPGVAPSLSVSTLNLPVVGLDLGTNLGVAILRPKQPAELRTLKLGQQLELAKLRRSEDDTLRRFDPRALCFFDFLKSLSFDEPPWVAFEDVKFIVSTAQGQLWATFRGVLWAAQLTCPSRYLAIPTGTLKQFATGNGAADKDQMRLAFEKKFSMPPAPYDDNLVDAAWIAAWAINYLTYVRPSKNH